MSVLETFYLLFKGDSSQLDKEYAKVEKGSKSATSALSGVDKAANHVSTSFINLAKNLAGLATAYVAANSLIGGFKHSIDYAIQVDQASRALGVNVEMLDQWSNAVKQTGGSSESFQASLRSLAEHLGTSSAVALRVLPRFAQAFHNMGQFQALRYGKMLGLDEPTILLLMKGRKELEALIERQKQLGFVTKQQAEIAHKFNLELIDTGHAFRSLFLTVGETVLPALTTALEFFVKLALYLREHSQLVIGALIGIGAAMAIAVAPFIAANAAFLATVGAIGLLIAAFALLYDDIKTFEAGGDSVIGDIVKKWPTLSDLFKDLGKNLKESDAITELEALADAVNLVVLAIEKLKSLGGYVSEYFKGGNTGTALNAQQQLSNANSSGLANSIFNTGSSASSITIGDITVNTTSTDPEGVGTAVSKHLIKMFRQASNQVVDGVVI